MARIHVATECGGAHVTRDDGAKLRGLIEQHWDDAEPLVLDFEGIRVASVSFFDEGLGLFAQRVALTELARRIKVENIDPGDRALLNRIVSSRSKEHAQTAEVRKFLADAGVPAEQLAVWDGVWLALYRDRAAVSASAEVAARAAQEKVRRGDWTLDLGHYQTGLRSDVGSALKAKLDELGIKYDGHSLGQKWSRSKRRSG